MAKQQRITMDMTIGQLFELAGVDPGRATAVTVEPLCVVVTYMTPQRHEITVKIPSRVDLVERGRAIKEAIDAHTQAGGRSTL